MNDNERTYVRGLLVSHGIASARRAITTDATEEVILVGQSDYDRVDVEDLTKRLMALLPHRKVWLAPDSAKWESEDV